MEGTFGDMISWGVGEGSQEPDFNQGQLGVTWGQQGPDRNWALRQDGRGGCIGVEGQTVVGVPFKGGVPDKGWGSRQGGRLPIRGWGSDSG